MNKLSLFSLCLCLPLIALPALAATTLDEASSSYAKHDYAKSLSLLDQIPSKARGAKADYYRALNLQALHRYDEAYSCFSNVAKQQKAPKLASMARQGMEGLSHISSQLKQTGHADNGSTKLSLSSVKADPHGFYQDDKWKVQKAPDLTKAPPADTTSRFQIIQTAAGCGRHH